MLDFTSALYLGMRHASWSIDAWASLTAGRPAALASPTGSREVAQRLAALQGCERALLAPSTLHLFWDLFGVLSGSNVAIYLDEGVYPIARWGAERAAARGVPVREFPHHNAQALMKLLKRDAAGGRSPLVVADGFCPGCGKATPVADYIECARAFGGHLILDDTQSLGILGHSPERDMPYGRGGGGALAWNKVSGPDMVLISSLAKGFGVPVAVLSGSERMIRHFESKSETRVHTSPPSVVAINAARRALDLNEDRGDDMRLRLASLVSRFRRQLRKAGFTATGGLFPVQTLARVKGLDAATLHERLLGDGVRAVLHQARDSDQAQMSFIITVGHQPDEIDRAVYKLADAARRKSKEYQRR
ncbi:MAG TPA: aminotransferase class I/II-fold pyridoxal phosphate-dependent enzyme [Blastocatellia bacterium]|nr:aminotransferase class I/II-fold pyridoxal phosphate-dependent enzyme [Blastocatellia bacterium]